MIAPLPHNETARLAALERYAVLDTPNEAVFDQFVGLTAGLLNTPIAMVGFIDQDRHWFKSAVNADFPYNMRENSFCQYTILENRVLCIPDTQKDQRVNDILPVTLLGVRFYAGAPLTTPDGLNIGTVCVFDHQPRTLEQADLDMLELLAKRVMEALNARLEVGVNTNASDTILESVMDSLGLDSVPLYGQASSEVLPSENDPILARVSEILVVQTPPEKLEKTVLERIQNLPKRPAMARVTRFGERILIAHTFGQVQKGFVWQAWALLLNDARAVPLEAFVASVSAMRLPGTTRMIGLSQEVLGQENPVPTKFLALGRVS